MISVKASLAKTKQVCPSKNTLDATKRCYYKIFNRATGENITLSVKATMSVKPVRYAGNVTIIAL